MGVVSEAVSDALSLFRPRNLTNWSGVSTMISGKAGFPDSKYQTYAKEGYQTNALGVVMLNSVYLEQ